MMYAVRAYGADTVGLPLCPSAPDGQTGRFSLYHPLPGVFPSSL